VNCQFTRRSPKRARNMTTYLLYRENRTTDERLEIHTSIYEISRRRRPGLDGTRPPEHQKNSRPPTAENVEALAHQSRRQEIQELRRPHHTPNAEKKAFEEVVTGSSNEPEGDANLSSSLSPPRSRRAWRRPGASHAASTDSASTHASIRAATV